MVENIIGYSFSPPTFNGITFFSSLDNVSLNSGTSTRTLNLTITERIQVLSFFASCSCKEISLPNGVIQVSLYKNGALMSRNSVDEYTFNLNQGGSGLLFSETLAQTQILEKGDVLKLECNNTNALSSNATITLIFNINGLYVGV